MAAGARWRRSTGQLPCHRLVHAAVVLLKGTVEDVGVLIRRHRIDDTISKVLLPITKANLVIIDDLGMLPISPDAQEGLYRIVDSAYEKRSLVVSSNLHPSGFDQIMEKNLATALVDRLLHHAHVVMTEGTSIRLQEATSGLGVVPLS